MTVISETTIPDIAMVRVPVKHAADGVRYYGVLLGTHWFINVPSLDQALRPTMIEEGREHLDDRGLRCSPTIPADVVAAMADPANIIATGTSEVFRARVDAVVRVMLDTDGLKQIASDAHAAHRYRMLAQAAVCVLAGAPRAKLAEGVDAYYGQHVTRAILAADGMSTAATSEAAVPRERALASAAIAAYLALLDVR